MTIRLPDLRGGLRAYEPRAADSRSNRCVRPAATSRRNSSHCSLKPLSRSAFAGTSSHWSRNGSVTGRSGFHTGFGVCARCWATHLFNPATAEPCVPSIWNSTSSSRQTRTAQEELICAMIPPSSSKMP